MKRTGGVKSGGFSEDEQGQWISNEDQSLANTVNLLKKVKSRGRNITPTVRT